MFGFKKKTDKQIEAEIKKDSKILEEKEHREDLEKKLSKIKTAKKELKYKSFERKYGGLIKGLHVAEEETKKGLKVIGKYYNKIPTKKRTTKIKRKKKKEFSGITW